MADRSTTPRRLCPARMRPFVPWKACSKVLEVRCLATPLTLCFRPLLLGSASRRCRAAPAPACSGMDRQSHDAACLSVEIAKLSQSLGVLASWGWCPLTPATPQALHGSTNLSSRRARCMQARRERQATKRRTRMTRPSWHYCDISFGSASRDGRVDPGVRRHFWTLELTPNACSSAYQKILLPLGVVSLGIHYRAEITSMTPPRSSTSSPPPRLYLIPPAAKAR